MIWIRKVRTMEHGFSILMFIFSGALFLYAGLMALTKDYKMLPYRSQVSVKPKDPKKYTARLAAVIALVAVAIAVGAAVALWNNGIGAVVMIVGVIIAIWRGTKMMKDVM